jgi:hypothetical protein
MIKLTDLFEDIMVTPKRVLIFKIPATVFVNFDDMDANSEIEYLDGVSISSPALLPDLNLYAKHPVMEFLDVELEIEEDTDKFDDVRCIFCAPKGSTYLQEGLPDGCSYDVTAYEQTGFCYVSFVGSGNIKLDNVEELVNILLPDYKAVNTVQDAANYLLFRRN